MERHLTRLKAFLPAAIGLVIIAGLLVRFYHISDNQFLFYDEGMYLGYNRMFLDLVANNPAHDLKELGIILSVMFKTALSTAKALWFFILNLRVFVFGGQSWYFARWVSAASGLGSVVLLYFWSRRYFQSRRAAALSALLLLILPSHVFYSRLGMQESLSTLLFLGAVYLYMLEDRVRWQLFASSFLLACVYFTNYRMIIAPVFMAFIECFETFLCQKTFYWRKMTVCFGLFYALVIFVGCLYGGVNLHVTTAWMFHQARDAEGHFRLVNFFSYPYYVFALEGFFFACLFWGNIVLIKLRDYPKLLPFGLVILQMLIFSFAAEKGARYLCVVLPFMAAAAAAVLDKCWQTARAQIWILTAGSLTCAGMLFLSASIAASGTDYESAVKFITAHDPQAVIVATQPLVEGLFLPGDSRMAACPNDLASLVELYKKGARYLVLDPQAYVSWTSDGRRFSPPLKDFLEFSLQKVRPLAVFPHLNKILLTRFVLDHNEQLSDSLTFLSRAPSEGFGRIRVYDLNSIFSALQRAHAEGSY
jgi:hypothetical protein